MNRKILGKLVIDIIMTVLMLAAMASRITENTIHKLVGISVFVLFIVHNIINRRWYLTILNGKNNAVNVFNTVVNLLLIISILTLMVSAVLISRTVFVFIPVKSGIIARHLHILAIYWCFILTSIHLGMHWRMIISIVRKMTGITMTNPIRTIMFRVIAILIVAYGVYASFDRDVGSKLVLYYMFEFWNIDESLMIFFTKYLSIMGIYICSTYYVLEFIQKNRKGKSFINMKLPVKIMEDYTNE